MKIFYHTCKLGLIHFKKQFGCLMFILLVISGKAIASGYASSSVAQVTGNVLPGSTNQQILVVTVQGNNSGFFSNWQINTCSFTMNNTNNGNVSNAKLWINTTNTFTGATQVGSTIINPTGTIIFTVGTGNIGNNSRFLFLTFNISSGSPCSGNSVDAFVPTGGLVITGILGGNGGSKTPSPSDPAGSRPIFNIVTPSVSIVSSGGGCLGSNITFNASVVNGGTSPFYQWKVNGINAGTNSSTFSTAGLSNNDLVLCELTSNADCATPVVVNSNTITVNLFSNPKPKIFPSDTILCLGTLLTMLVHDTGSFSGGYPVGTTYDFGLGLGLDSTFLINGSYTYPVTVVLPAAYGSCSALSNTASNFFIDAPYAILSADSTSCHSSSDGMVYTEVLFGTVPFHYKWYLNGTLIKDTISSLAFDTLKNATVGTYCLVVLDSIAGVQSGLVCASDSGCIDLFGPDEISIADVKSNITCQGESDGAIDIAVSGGVGPFTYLWSNGQTNEDLSLLSPGSYLVTVTDQHNCQAQHTVSLITTPDILPPILNCPADISVVLNPGQCSAVVNYFSPLGSDNCPGVHTIQTAGLASGSVFPTGITLNTFVATDSVGNSTTCSFFVTIVDNELPGIICPADILLNNTPGMCGAIASYTLPVISDNCAVASFIQTTGLPSGSLFPAGITTNTFEVTDSAGNVNSCSFSVIVADIDFPVITCIPDTIIVNQTGVNGAIFNYPVLFSDNCSATLTQTSGLSSGSFFPVGATVNSFVATDPAGNNVTCTFMVTVVDNELPVAVCQPISVLLDTNGSIAIDPLMVDGGSTDNSGIFTRSLSPDVFTCSQTGINNVVLTITDIHGNVSSCTTTVTVSSSLFTQVTPNPVQLCSGGSILLSGNVTGGSEEYFSHHWSGENGNVLDTTVENTLFVSANPGTYHLTYTVIDSHGCIANDTLSVEVFPLLTLSVVKTDVTCFSGNNGTSGVLFVGGSGNVTYLWNTGATTSSLAALTAGTYTVSVLDNIGCSASQTITITEPSDLLLSTSATNTGCSGLADGTATVAVAGGVAGYSYLWTNGQTTATATGLVSGSYGIAVSDANGCIKTANVTVFPTTITVQLSGSLYNGGFGVHCNGGNDGFIDLTVISGVGPFTYLWNTGESTESIAGLVAGTYTVTVSSGFCTTLEQLAITQPSPLSILMSSTHVDCFGSQTGTASALVAGGVPGYQYSWNTIPVKTTSEINNIGQGNYSVTVTDANGCSQNNQVSVTQPPAINISGIITNLKCRGDVNGAINISANGGVPPYTYLWNSGSTNEDRTGLKAKSYTVTVTDANGCTKSAIFQVTEPSFNLFVLTNKTNVRCFGNNNGKASVIAFGGVSPYTYSWNTIPVNTTSTINNLVAGSYQCTITDAAGCIKVMNMVITQPALLVLTTSQSNVTTNGGQNGTASVAVSGGTSGFSYQWNTVPLKTTAGISNLSAGTYTVKVTDSKGCSKTAVVIITQPAPKSSALDTKANPVVKAFPNPSYGLVTLELYNVPEKEFYILVYDLLGNKVYQDRKFGFGQTKKQMDFNFQYLNKGIYMMEVKGASFKRVIKLIIQ